jgi:hypothetical protein
MNPMNLYEELNNWLTNITDQDFRRVMRGFLEPFPDKLAQLSPDRASRGDFLGLVQELHDLPKLRSYLIALFPERFPPSDPRSPASPAATAFSHVPFTNRRRELRELSDTSLPGQYFLVSAPAGYGKSELLTQLRRKFNGDWDTALSVIGTNMTLDDLTADLATQMNLTVDKNQVAGLRLSSAWKNRYRSVKMSDGTSKNGILLIVDFDKEPYLPTLKDLLDEFIPDFERNLQSLDDYTNGTIRLRVIIAGRSLAATREATNSRLETSLITYSLSPFNYEVVKETAREYLTGENPESINKLAAHVLHLTGGHPGCMARMLEGYKRSGLNVDDFLATYLQTSYRTDVQQTAAEIVDSIFKEDASLRQAVVALSFFRYVDDGILSYIWAEFHLKDSHLADPFDFRDRLTQTYLFGLEERRFLKDAIIRRLVVIHLQNSNPAEYHKQCQQTLEQCRQRIAAGEAAEQWAMEYLYQSLLPRAADVVTSAAQRQQLRDVFYDTIVKAVVELFLEQRRVQRSSEIIRQAVMDHQPIEQIQELQNYMLLDSEIRSAREILLRELDQRDRDNSYEHWELRFAVNYFLRKNENYTDEPLQTLKVSLANYFNDTRRPGGRSDDTAG